MSEGTGAGAPPAIELRDIVKRFPGVVANDHVNVNVAAGSIHAIVGENGAGKSTLMKVLYGSLKPDEGTVTVNGVEQHFRSPKDAINVGIGMVFQHFMLADNFTVWENVVLGDEPGTPIKLNIREAKAKIRELAKLYGLDIDPDDLTGELGVGERQRVEILKVLYRGARIIILDEPTAVLVPQEVDELFASLRELVAGGVTVIFISHKLNEVLSVADAITVIRAGRTVAEVLPQDVTARELAELMVGSELPSPETKAKPPGDHVALALTDVSVQQAGRAALSDIGLEVHRGEIVGIAGVEGNGQDELIDVIVGIEVPTTGKVELEGKDVTKLSTRHRREQGLGYIPQDRHRDGLVLDAPLWENVVLGHQTQSPFVRHFLIDRRSSRKRTEEIIEEFDVRTPGPDVDALALSGGNQQKLIVGKEMMADPIILIAAQPTRGVDVGAQADIWDQLREARAADLAVLLVSADLDELIGLSDTLYVIYRGRLVAKLDPATVTPAELGEYMTGARGEQGAGMKLRSILLWLAAPVIAAVSAIIISSITLLLSGNSPTEAFDAMWDYVTTADSFVFIINRAVPYYVAACAVAIGFKMNLFNIGVDGQYRLAALFAAAAGAALDLPAVFQISAILLVAMVVGGAYAAIPGVLKVTRGVNEVVSTIMLNFVAVGITAYLLANNFRNEAVTLQAETDPLPPSGQLPPMNGFLEKFGIDLPEPLTGFLPFAIAVGIAFYVIIYRTRFGFDLRTSGKNPNAARSSGVNPKAMILKTMILSGMIAGLAGMSPLLTEFHKYGDTFPLGIGFTGIAVALLGRNSPAGIAVAAIVWAGIERASQNLSSVGVPQEIGQILQGTLLLSAVIAFEVVRRYRQRLIVKEAADKTAAERVGPVPMGATP